MYAEGGGDYYEGVDGFENVIIGGDGSRSCKKKMAGFYLAV